MNLTNMITHLHAIFLELLLGIEDEQVRPLLSSSQKKKKKKSFDYFSDSMVLKLGFGG